MAKEVGPWRESSAGQLVCDEFFEGINQDRDGLRIAQHGSDIQADLVAIHGQWTPRW